MRFEIICSFLKIILLKMRNKNRVIIHPVQVIDKSLKIYTGKKSKVVIGKGMKCRRNCTIRCDEGNIVIGDGVFMNENVSITSLQSIEIGNNVTIANNVVIVDHDHNYKKKSDDIFITDKVSIGDECWIGANAVILKGVVMGKACVVAAGTVVRAGEYPDNSLIYESKISKCVSYCK